MTITIITGSGQYQDRWHDFTAVGYETARALEPLGHDIRMRSFKPGSVIDVEGSDLVVVLAGRGEWGVADGPQEEWPPAYEALRTYREAGGPILALHIAASELPGIPEWNHWIGGRWIVGTSMHPPIGDSRVHVTDTAHPITDGVTDFELYDEMYSYLEVDPDATVLLTHDYADTTHALVWAIERDGARSVYDALGHHVRAFEAPERAELLRREAAWLLER